MLLVVAAQLLVALDVDVPVLRPAVALTTFVALPTLVLWRRATGAAYAFGLTLLGLLTGGLLLDAGLGAVGVDHPLAPLPLAVAGGAVDVALLLWRRSIPLLDAPPGAGDRARGARRAVRAAAHPGRARPAALGRRRDPAQQRRRRRGRGRRGRRLGRRTAGPARRTPRPPPGVRRRGRLAGLRRAAAGTSLRGWNITGHDIQAEFLAFGLTDHAQNWDMSALPSAYNACLSRHDPADGAGADHGFLGALVFKLLLQLVFALVPVLTYLFARRFVDRRLALLAAVFTVAFPTFFTDMPYLVRQEVAFFFLALALLVATRPVPTRGAPAGSRWRSASAWCSRTTRRRTCC